MPSPLVAQVARHFAIRARWGPLEYAFWLAALASVFLLPGRHLILTEVAWLALFALSLDLILGYAGIISLGHAAFFGFGSYAAALLAKHGIINEPVLALVASGLCAAVLGFASSFLVLRGSDLTRLMVTLGIALILREIANLTPQYWQFWIGLLLVAIVLVGRERIGYWTGGVRALAETILRRLIPGAAPVTVPPGEGR